MSRTSRRVHVIEIEPGGPVRSVIGNMDINGRPLVLGQRFESREYDTLHEYEITSVDPKRARWVRAISTLPPVVQQPWSAS